EKNSPKERVRLPIPVRLADLETHVLRTFYQKNHM
ncbi:endonuclease V, partial [Bacillus subtilis]